MRATTPDSQVVASRSGSTTPGGRARAFARLMRATGLAAVTGLVVAGCTTSLPRTHYYRIAVPKPEAPAVAIPRLDGVLAVERFTADGLIDDRPILQADDGGLEVRPSHYHYWTEPPTEMLQEQLAGYLQAAKVATTVVTAEARIRRQYVIRGRINRFERVRRGDTDQVSIAIRLTLASDRAGKVLWMQTYEAEVEPADPSIAAAVDAFRRGTADIFARFTGDIRARIAG